MAYQNCYGRSNVTLDVSILIESLNRGKRKNLTDHIIIENSLGQYLNLIEIYAKERGINENDLIENDFLNIIAGLIHEKVKDKKIKDISIYYNCNSKTQIIIVT